MEERASSVFHILIERFVQVSKLLPYLSIFKEIMQWKLMKFLPCFCHWHFTTESRNQSDGGRSSRNFIITPFSKWAHSYAIKIRRNELAKRCPLQDCNIFNLDSAGSCSTMCMSCTFEGTLAYRAVSSSAHSQNKFWNLNGIVLDG